MDGHIEKQNMVLYATRIQKAFLAAASAAAEKGLRKTCSKKGEGKKGQAFHPIRGRDASPTRARERTLAAEQDGEQGRLPGQIYRSTVTKRAE